MGRKKTHMNQLRCLDKYFLLQVLAQPLFHRHKRGLGNLDCHLKGYHPIRLGHSTQHRSNSPTFNNQRNFYKAMNSYLRNIEYLQLSADRVGKLYRRSLIVTFSNCYLF